MQYTPGRRPGPRHLPGDATGQFGAAGLTARGRRGRVAERRYDAPFAMATDAWQRVKAVLGDALDRAPHERVAYVDQVCADDAALRAEVHSLLAAHAAADDFIETPAFAGLAPASAPESRDTDPNPGRAIGPYVLERLIGRGGMGAVYLARRADREFDQRVAIKMIRRGMDSDLLVRRFRHERQILATLDHPHIARLFDGGTSDDGLPYFVMEYVEGVAIDRYADDRRLDTAGRLRLCLRVIDAVQHAHDRHVVHRDIKPSNVLVTADGQPKLLDFGIAKLLDRDAPGSSTLTAMYRPMTPDYASPEQIRGDQVSAATDVYALGLLLYELLTGHRPYRPASRAPADIAKAICDQDPERPSAVIARTEAVTDADGTTTTVTAETVSATRDGTPETLRRRLSGALDDILLKALRKDPADRYSTPQAFADDIRRYLDDQPVAARQGALAYATRRFVVRHRLALAGSLLVVLSAGLTAIAVSRRPLANAPAAASAAKPAPRRSAAVLHFRNLSGRQEDAWLAVALAEMLTTELAGGGQIRVVPSAIVARAERDAGRPEGALAPEARERLRLAMAADHLVHGAFTVGAPPERTLRLDVQVQSAGGDDVAVAQSGREADLFALVADTGQALRRRLGLEEHSAETERGVRAALPRTVEATRHYAVGLERLRELDAVAARDAFARAAELDPGNAMIETGLAAAWTALGYDRRAAEAAQAAFDASAGLSREERLNVEGRLHEAQKAWPKAVDVYRTLWGFFADNVEYGLRLAGALTSSGRAKEAVVTIAELRALPAPQGEDPRIELAEAAAAGALGDFPQQQAAAMRAVARASSLGASLLLARARMAEGQAHYSQGQHADAVRAFEDARDRFTAAGDRAGEAGALNSLGSVTDDKGDTRLAERYYQASLAASEAIGDRRAMSAALNNLGILLKDAGRLAEARQVHERALALRREIGDRNWTAVSLSNIGVVLFEQDRLPEAADYYRQSLAIAQEISDKRSEVRALHNLAIVQRESGDMRSARATYEAAIPGRAAVNDRRGGVIARVELGMALLALGDLDGARRVQEEARTMARAIPMAEGESQAEYQFGEIALVAGDLAGSRARHEAALAMRRAQQQKRTTAESLLALAIVAIEDGRHAEAGALVTEAMSLAKEQPALLAQAELVQVRLRLAAGDVPGAASAVTRARSLVGPTGRASPRWALALAEARVAAGRGQAAEARRRLEALRAELDRLGLPVLSLEVRLVLADVAVAAGAPGATADARRLAADAKAVGAGLVQRRAEALAGT